MKKVLSLCVILFSHIPVFRQSERLLRFSAVSADNDEKVLVRWTMAAGSTCLDVRAERSSDNISFQEVHVYPGVCSNEDST